MVEGPYQWEIEVAKKAQKKIVRREYTKADVKELRGPFESEDANNQNHEADQKNGRFVASESAQARHRSRASPITEQQAHLVINAS